MKITADTNVLIRAAVQDHKEQALRAAKVLQRAELVAVPLTVLCEFVWVLSRGYQKTRESIAEAIHCLITCDNVVINRPAVEAGLKMLMKGGDFADGIIAFEGQWLGADKFVSFDKKAVTLLQLQGKSAQWLS